MPHKKAEPMPRKKLKSALANENRKRYGTFRMQLEDLINKCSMENGSDTPDFILADYLLVCLKAFDYALTKRTTWKRTILRLGPC